MARTSRRGKRAETKQERYRRTHPWVPLLCWARRRCRDKDSKWFRYYGGLPCTITAADVKAAWIAAGADSMEKPSLDRIEGEKGYVPGNIRVIEFKCNARMAWDESFKFLFNGGDPSEACAPVDEVPF